MEEKLIERKNSKRPTFKSQFLTMLWFRSKLSLRDKKFFILGVILPMISVLTSILLSHVLIFPPNSDYTIENTSLNSDSNPILLMPTTTIKTTFGEELMNTMKQEFNLTFIYFNNESSLTKEIQSNSISNFDYGISYTDKLSLDNLEMNIYYNNSIRIIPSIIHTIFMSLNQIMNSNNNNNNTGNNIQQLQLNENLIILSSGVTIDVFYLLMPLIIQYGFVFFIPYFAILIVTDRDKGFKNHLILNSLRKSVYWLSNLIFNYLIYLIPTLIGWILLYSFKIDGIYGNGFISVLLFMTFGLSAISFGFILQFIFDKEETANKWLYPITSIFTAIPSTLISIAFPKSTPLSVELILSILPTFSFCNGLKALTYNNTTVVYYTIIIQLLSSLFYLFLIYIIENYKSPKKNKINFNNDNESLNLVADNEGNIEDEDVIQEKEKIKSLVQNCHISSSGGGSPKIIIDGIYKQFIQPKPTLNKPSLFERLTGSSSISEDDKIIKKAVDGIWFSVYENEIFGLLGPNGSGKSTCLNVLTGLLKADYGDGYLSGKSIDKDKDVFQSIGSCSQNDILFENLTIYEHLFLFSKLKSNSSNQEIENEIEFFINKFTLESFKNKKSSDLSGGNKRKCSVACSLIGNPKVVLMDEPSTSLDPISRKELHSLIDQLKLNKSIIMTTHSINEINECCSRVAIMVDGKIKCIGTPNHLKQKYGSGYTIDIIPIHYLNSGEIHNFMKQQFPLAKKVERLGRFISYDLPIQDKQSLATIFKIIQLNKQALGILDFSVCSSTLEKVFLKFANQQESINQEQELNKNSIN